MKIKLSILTVVLLVSACGGGGTTSPLASITGTGVSGAGSTTSTIKIRGTITGFGSIFVNGIEFETDTANVILDNNTGVQDDLKLGMVVEITGEVDDSGISGQASEINFDDDVQGPIASITVNADQTEKQLTILNKTVIVNKITTVFEGVTFETLSNTDLLEISGFFDASGNLKATRVERKESFSNDSSEIEIKGIVSNLSGNTFSLDSFTVDFSSANLNDVPGGVISNDMSIEVKGTLNGTSITATEIHQENDFFGEDEENISIEGPITDFVGIDNFIVAGQAVDASSAEISPSSLSLENSLNVEVEGAIVNGTLVAESIEARSGDIEIAGNISSLDQTTKTITLQFVGGTVDLVTNSKTRMEDETELVDILTFDRLTAGDYLEIKALYAENDLVASEIKRDQDGEDKIQGSVEDFSEQLLEITVLGLTYSVDGATFQNQEEQTISSSDFFNLISTGTVIKIIDENSDGTAEEVEME